MNPEATIAVVSAVIASSSMIAAFWQARSARRQTRLQQQMLEDAAQPYVWADIRPDERDAVFFHFLLRNEGPTVAEDVCVEINPPLPESWRAAGALKPAGGEFASLPPGRTMTWNLGVTSDVLAADGDLQFDITITAWGPYGPLPSRAYRLDLSRYERHVQRAPGTLSGVAKAIDGLTKQVKQANAG